MSVLTYRYRIKDSTSSTHLLKMAGAVNYVWNYCQEVSLLAFRRDKTFLSVYDLHKLTAGTSKDLRLSADTIQQVCTEYVTRKKQFKKIKLKWRSKKRSLGWIPFKAAYIRLEDDTVTYCGARFRLWLSRPVEGTVKTGSFTQDARGRWYINLQCEVPDAVEPVGHLELGIDLGLTNQIACSDGIVYSRPNVTRRHADALAIAQRAHKKKRVTAIQTKIGNTRADWTHKATTAIARRARLMVIGDVSSAKLIKTPFAKSTYDASWYSIRHQLSYKAIRLAGACVSGDERFSSVTCSDCGTRCGPSGLSRLGVREWACSQCGTLHERDVNAARNILMLRTGRGTPIKGIPALRAGRTSRSCPICPLPIRPELDAALTKGQSYRALARQYMVKKNQVTRHAQHRTQETRPPGAGGSATVSASEHQSPETALPRCPTCGQAWATPVQE